MLAKASRAHMDDIFPHLLKQRQSLLKIRLVAADHNGQRPVAGAAVAAGNRRVHHPDAFGLALLIKPNRQRGRRGGHVNGKSASLRVVQNTVLQKDLFHIRRIAHHDKNHVGVLHGLCHRFAGRNAKLFFKL